jgi:hypothetical protein
MADDIKPLDGKTTVDDKMVFEPQRLSYDAARVIAEKIARRISGRTKDKVVVIAGRQLLADFSNLVATKAVLEELANEYDALAKATHASTPVVPAAVRSTRVRTTELRTLNLAAPLETVTAGVQGALALLSLFRQDVDYKGVPVSIDTLGFELELAARIRMHKASEVIVPDFALVTAPEKGVDALRTLVEKVKEARSGVILAAESKLPHSKNEDLVDEAAMKSGGHVVDLNHPPIPAPRSNLEMVGEVFAQIDQHFTDLQTQLAKGDTDGSGLTMLARLYRAEALNARSPLLVHVRVLLAGGSNRIERSLFRTLFSGDGLSATGGAVVSWAILSKRGAIEDGGTFTESLSAASPKPPDSPVSIP